MEMTRSFKHIQLTKSDKVAGTSSLCFSIFVGLMVALNTYTVPGLPFLSIDELLFIVSLPFFLLLCKQKNALENRSLILVLFCIYALIVSFFSAFFVNDNVLNVFVRVVREAFYYVIIFWIGNRLFSFDTFRKVFSKITLLLAFFVIVQALVYYTIGFFIPGLLMDITINDNGFTGREMYNSLLTNASYSGYLKPNGFLTEPSTCAHCFFIYLIIELFAGNGGKRFYKIGFVSFAMIATMSTSAFLELFLAWALWLFWFKRKVFIILFAVLVLGLPTLFLSLRNSNSVFGAVINRLFDAFSPDKSEFSSGLRVTRGFVVFNSLPAIYKTFGIGFGSYEAFVKSNIINPSLFSDMDNEYMNSFSYLLVSSGFIGISLFILYYAVLFKSRNRMGRAFIFALAFLFFGTSVYCSSFFVIIMLLILDSKKTKYGRPFNPQL